MMLAVGLPFLDGALVINQRAAGRPAQAAFALSSPFVQRAQVFARVQELDRECVYVYCVCIDVRTPILDRCSCACGSSGCLHAFARV